MCSGLHTWRRGAPCRRRTAAWPWRSSRTGRIAARPPPTQSSTPAAAAPGTAPCPPPSWRAAPPARRPPASRGRRSSSRTWTRQNGYTRLMMRPRVCALTWWPCFIIELSLSIAVVRKWWMITFVLGWLPLIGHIYRRCACDRVRVVCNTAYLHF